MKSTYSSKEIEQKNTEMVTQWRDNEATISLTQAWDIGNRDEYWSDHSPCKAKLLFRILGFKSSVLIPTAREYQKLIQPDDLSLESDASQTGLSDPKKPHNVIHHIIRPGKCREHTSISKEGNALWQQNKT